MTSLLKSALSGICRLVGVHSISDRERILLDTVKRELLPQTQEPSEDYVPKRVLGTAGFALNIERQLELVKVFQGSNFQALFQALRNNPEINVGFRGKDFKDLGLIHNGYYPSPDAEIYAAMIALTKPDRIVEVGSGYSTVVARAALSQVGLQCPIHVIDPSPRRDVENVADQIEYAPVEKSTLGDLDPSGNTLLFIDSSHVCRSGGDLPYVYCKILPALPAGVLVHIHDIFIPFDYPDNYFERFYTEAYLLHALLANSTKFEVVLATHYLAREHRDAMQAAFGPGIGQDPLFFGASFWIRSK